MKTLPLSSPAVTRCKASPPPKPALPEMPRPEFPRPTLHVYETYGWLRRFNCIPSWAARIEDAWWFYDAAKMREEMALARSVHANAICLWIEFTAWFRDPAAMTANFLDAVAAIDENGMKAMPCLFNRWHDAAYDYGGTHIEDLAPGQPSQLEYVRALVTPLAADPRIFCWNLCNEPQAAADATLKKFGEELCRREYQWLMGIATTMKDCGARQPMTNGTNYREMLAAAGHGSMTWSIREGRSIAARRDRMDSNGINGKGYHPRFNAGGSLRRGHEWMREKPTLAAPWETA